MADRAIGRSSFIQSTSTTRAGSSTTRDRACTAGAFQGLLLALDDHDTQRGACCAFAFVSYRPVQVWAFESTRRLGVLIIAPFLRKVCNDASADPCNCGYARYQ